MSNDTAIRDPRVGTVVQDRYRILQRLAAGGMGVVYRGERVGLGRAVAVKFLHPWVAEDASFKLRFELEAQAMGRLNHPSCVSVIDWGIDEGAPFLVMDYVAGPTLRLVLREGRLQPRRALELIRQVLAGLAHAHAQGVVHRDLKPDNLVLTEVDGLGELVRILDFGLAKLKDSATGLSMGMVMGTPNYMPPEQVRAELVDERSDLYAVGAMLFEVLTGGAPFSASASSEIMRRQLHEAPPRLAGAVPGAGFSEALESVVARALAKSPEARFQSAAAFAKALEATPEASAASVDGPRGSAEAGTLEARGALTTAAGSGPAGAGATKPTSPLEPTQVSGSAPLAPDAGARPEAPERSADSGMRALDADPGVRQGSAAASSGKTAGPREVDVGLARPSSRVAAAGAGESDAASRTRSMRKAGAVGAEHQVSALVDDASGARVAGDPAAPVPAAALAERRGSITRAVLAGGVAVVLLIAGVGLVQGRSSEGGESTAVTPPATSADSEVGGAASTVAGGSHAVSPGRSGLELDPVEARAEETEPGGEDAEARVLAGYATLARQGQRDRALRALATYRAQHPASAAAARLEGQINFAHLRWDDGLRAYGEALRLAPGLREDRALIADVIGCLVSDSAHRKCGRFLATQIGAPALPQLEEAARSSRYANVQHRARRLIAAGGFSER